MTSSSTRSRQLTLHYPERLFTAIGQRDPVASLSQAVANDVGDVAIVVDDENVHARMVTGGQRSRPTWIQRSWSRQPLFLVRCPREFDREACTR